MKRITSFILTAMVIFGILAMPREVRAVTLDSKAGIVATSVGRLNVRKTASTASPAVAALNKGSYVTLISKTGSWWYVEYAKGQYGYCHGNYITSAAGSTATVNTNSGNLNVRSGAGTGYAKIGSLSKGESVIVLSGTGTWSKILYHGTKTGYVSSRYLSGYAPVLLSVPSFKQTDSRWANVQIGTSGKTFAQIGCATTAVAMMESYRTGRTITPDTMAKQLRYTATGNLYWPSDYTAVTSSSGYLNSIYLKLSQGKPVLFGAKNASGKQHWVVITGFAGGAALTPSAFIIHDPGTYSRTNLQQFLNAYPTFYKYFYYQ